MTDEQRKHLAEIRYAFDVAVNNKYAQGVKSHGGNLWERSAVWLVEQAMEEAVDQWTYLYTVREALLKDPANSVFISQDDKSICTCSKTERDVQCPTHGGSLEVCCCQENSTHPDCSTHGWPR